MTLHTLLNRKQFVGVVSLEMSLFEYTFTDERLNSYVYILRKSDGAIFYHPEYQLPADELDDTRRIQSISELEIEAEQHGVHAMMMQ